MGIIYIKMPIKTQRMDAFYRMRIEIVMHYRFLQYGFIVVMLCLTLHGGVAMAQPESDSDTIEAAEEGLASHSGLAVPRFVSVKYDEVNLRTGPGRRYPIRWVYTRKHLPVEVTEEFGHWRKLRDVEGDEGWVHKSQISGTRTAIFKEDTILRRYPEDSSPPMIKVQKNVVGQILECDIEWCEIQVESYKSWVRKNAVWGVYPRETL
ncbi:MAG: hypothetical protein MK052_00645 [Alphaproteobacteria bacterium]|nr:hypothetical protein [Alphaproteobacteria bacterium]